MDKHVTVYSSDGCVECDKVKQMLENEGIPFEVKDVLASEQYQKEVEQFGFMGIPVTVVGDKAVKGFTPEFMALIEEVRK